MALSIGLPAIIKMGAKMMIPPVAIFGALITTQYLLPPSTYYDEYDGTASEYAPPAKWFNLEMHGLSYTDF